MNTLKNKVALITGSARGLGKAIAQRYAALGADVVINYSKDKASAYKVVSNINQLKLALNCKGDTLVLLLKNLLNDCGCSKPSV